MGQIIRAIGQILVGGRRTVQKRRAAPRCRTHNHSATARCITHQRARGAGVQP